MRSSSAQPAASSAVSAATVLRFISGLLQLDFELHLHVGADGVARLPLAEADAEGSALERQLAFHDRAVARRRPAERHRDLLLHALERQRTVRDVALAVAAQVGGLEAGLGKAR